jgi:hypothetical protein
MGEPEVQSPSGAPASRRVEPGESGEPAGGTSVAPAVTGSTLLAADVGTVYTKVYFFEDVAGERRLVSIGRAPTCGPDGMPAPQVALAAALEQALGRAGRPERATQAPRLLLSSAGAVARLAIVASGSEEVKAISDGLEGLPVRVLEPIYLHGRGGDAEQLLGQLEAQAPDAVIVAGAARGEARALAGAAVETIDRKSVV